MSQENVEIVRSTTEAFNRRDREAWLRLNDPEVAFRAAAEWPESGTVRGPEAVWDFIVSLTEPWEQEDFEMVEFVDVDDDNLVARFRRPVQGKASGITEELDYWCMNSFREGKIVSHEWFASREEALEAAGLSE